MKKIKRYLRSAWEWHLKYYADTYANTSTHADGHACRDDSR